MADDRKVCVTNPAAEVSTGPYPDRRIRVGVWTESQPDGLAVNTILDPGSDVTLAADETAGLAVPGWSEPPLVLISGGTLLNLGPGMRLIMCDEAGGRRVAGEFEELCASGMSFPMPVLVSRLNIRVRKGASVFVELVTASWRPSQTQSPA
jgi:hypothetical protein